MLQPEKLCNLLVWKFGNWNACCYMELWHSELEEGEHQRRAPRLKTLMQGLRLARLVWGRPHDRPRVLFQRHASWSDTAVCLNATPWVEDEEMQRLSALRWAASGVSPVTRTT